MPSLETNQMPTWDQLKQSQSEGGPHSGFLDVEAMAQALGNVSPGNAGLPASNFENEWTMPREPAAAAQHPGVAAALFNDDEHRVPSPHQGSSVAGQSGEQGWGGAAGRFLGNLF